MRSSQLRRVLVLLLSASLLTIAAGTASAAPSKPTLRLDSQVVTGTTFGTSLVVNRTAKQIASCTYVVDNGSPVSCGTKVPAGKSTTYAVSITGQSVGAHTVTVTVVLTDGGRGTVSTSFRIGPLVFVRAWGDVDEVEGYNPATDVLFNEIVDTNGSLVLDVGDTIKTYGLPGDFTGTTLAGTGATYTVLDLNVEVVSVSDGFAWVATGGGEFTWAGVPSVDLYQEVGATYSHVADLRRLDPNQRPDDEIVLQAGSPSGPTINGPMLYQSQDHPADDWWFEVAVSATGL